MFRSMIRVNVVHDHPNSQDNLIHQKRHMTACTMFLPAMETVSRLLLETGTCCQRMTVIMVPGNQLCYSQTVMIVRNWTKLCLKVEKVAHF